MALWAREKIEKIPFDYGLLYKNAGTENQEQLGISKGGGEFELAPEIRQLEVDGVKGDTEGLKVVDSINATLKCELANVSLDMLYLAMPYATMTGTAGSYTKLTIDKNSLGLIPEDRYIDNLTMCAKTYEGKYVRIDIANVLNMSNFTFSAKPKEEGVIAFEFKGHWSNTDDDAKFVEITYENELPTAS